MIRTENLTKTYHHGYALAGVTFELPKGSVFALTGPNGAGKSTAIKIFLNLIRPSAGTAEVLGVNSTRLGAAELSEIGYVSEDQKLPEWMRVDYFVKYCRALYPSWDDARAAELIHQFELPVQQRLHNLSRGMKVKAALTVSLAYRPKLILLDEPFSGLDMLVRDQLIESIVDCTPEATVLIASHDLAEIESFATHVGYLNEGRLEFIEEMGSLSRRFREVELTLDRPSELPAELPPAWLNAEQSGVAVRFTDSHFEPGRSHEEVAHRFGGVRDIQSREMSVRAIFLALAKSRKVRCV